MPASTSPIESGYPVRGFTLSVGTGSSPEFFSFIANMDGYNQAMKATIVMTTNVGDTYVRRTPTLIDPGTPTFTIFWVPLETSHRNSVGGGAVAAGLRYLMINQLLRDFQAAYAPDANGNVAEDAYKAFVTDFGISGKVGDVFRANITLGINDTNPSFV